MSYQQFRPHPLLASYIDAYWIVTGDEKNVVAERIIPDACVDIIVNLGSDFITEGGNVVMKSDTAYLVGTMTRFKETFRPPHARLIGVRFKPASFSLFYNYASLQEVTNTTVELDKKLAPQIDLSTNDVVDYFNRFFLERLTPHKHTLFPLITLINERKGQITVEDLSREQRISVRQMERNFKQHIGITPKEFINFIRYQFAEQLIHQHHDTKSLLEIALETGYYDHSHLSNEVKKYTGLNPSEL